MTSALQGRKKESHKIFDDIAGTYDFLNHILSFGIDIYWRKKLLKNLPQKNDLLIMDLATGTGDVALVLGKDKRVSKVEGLDMSQGMINVGREKVKKAGLEKTISMEIGDGCNLPKADNLYDAATLSFGIRNFPNAQQGLKEIKRVLKPGGKALIMEFGLPSNLLVKAVYLLYFRYLLPFVGNIVSKHKDAYSYLNETVEDFPYGEDFTKMMKEEGYKNINIIPLTFGIANLYVGEK